MEGKHVGYGGESLPGFVEMSKGIGKENPVAEFDCDCSSSKGYGSH